MGSVPSVGDRVWMVEAGFPYVAKAPAVHTRGALDATTATRSTGPQANVGEIQPPPLAKYSKFKRPVFCCDERGTEEGPTLCALGI